MDENLINAIQDEDDDGDKFLKAVLDSGVDVNALGKNSWDSESTTAINMAINTGNINKVRLILETGRVNNINLADGYGRTPLFLAARGSNSEIVQLLLLHGADVHVKPFSQTPTPLDVAATDEIRELLEEYDKRNKTMLMRKIYDTPQDKGGLGLGDNGLDVNGERDLYKFLGGSKKMKTVKKKRKYSNKKNKTKKMKKSNRRRRL